MKISLDCNQCMIVKDFVKGKTSRNFWGFLKTHNGQFFFNNNNIKPYETISQGELVITFDNEKSTGYAMDLPLSILYEDRDIMIIDKDAGLQTIPSSREYHDSVFNRLLSYFAKKEASIHFINRLDKETSGLLLVALNPYVACLLAKEKIDKEYLVETIKPLENSDGIIDLPIDRGEGIKRMVRSDGQKAVTCYTNIENNIYKVILKTGRTHQIRVHFGYYGAFVANDPLYGNGEIKGPMKLLCYKMQLLNPVTKKAICVYSQKQIIRPAK